MHIQILSDPICPWCLIGWSHLRRALDAAGREAQIHWRVFMLNPTMPPEGMDRRDYLNAKFGGPEGAAQVYGRVAEAAKAAGLDLRLDAIPRTPSTIDAHRLIRWAPEPSRMAEALFDAYFRQAHDIGDRAVLAELAEQAGLEATADRLASDEDAAAIRAEDSAHRGMGVSGVPLFILNETHALSSAQPSDVWERVFEQVG